MSPDGLSPSPPQFFRQEKTPALRGRGAYLPQGRLLEGSGCVPSQDAEASAGAVSAVAASVSGAAAMGDGLFRHIYHPGAALFIEMGQFSHVYPPIWFMVRGVSLACSVR